LNDSSYLLKWAFTQTSETKILSKGQIIKNVDVWLGNKPTINLIVDKDIVSILSFDQLQLISSSIIYEKPINAPIKKGQKLGNLIIEISGKKKIDVPLVSDSDVNEINPIFKFFAAIKYLIFGTSLDEV
jgi:D-alanyl-D-alanine carboxypeptidase